MFAWQYRESSQSIAGTANPTSNRSNNDEWFLLHFLE